MLTPGSRVVQSALARNVSFQRGAVADAAELAAFGARTFIETYSVTSSRPGDIEAHVKASFGIPQQSKELADDSSTTIILARSSDKSQLLAYAQIVAPSPLPISVPSSYKNSEDSVAAEDMKILSVAPTMELKRFYVDSQAHGSGIAAMLMDHVFDVARNQGQHQYVWLGVWEENPRAISYYTKKAGFWEVGTTVFAVGSDKQTDRVLVAAVPPV
jgi:ribosomal protein S18 acetylase RimI-like enzyme